MQYQQLGKSSLHISRIGLGCMSLRPGNETANIELLHHALDLGINYFDTADLYDKGLNEELLGNALVGKRDQAIIATKVGNQWKAGGTGWDWNPRKEYILKAAEESLRRLKTDRIDLYQLHGGTIEDPIDETIEAFELLQQQGKIRYYGISSIRPNVIREYVKRSGIVSVMLQYSIADRRPEETVLALLEENNIGVLCRGALAQGMLVNKPAKDYLAHSAAMITKAAAAIRTMSSQRETPAQVCTRFVLQHPAVTAAITGVSHLRQLEAIIGTTGNELLTDRDIQLLQNILPVKQYEQHR